MKEYIENVVAPRLQADGGWVEFVEQREDCVTLAFRGECSKCEVLNRCADWIAGKILEELGVRVRVNAIRKKPFFLDRDI